MGVRAAEARFNRQRWRTVACEIRGAYAPRMLARGCVCEPKLALLPGKAQHRKVLAVYTVLNIFTSGFFSAREESLDRIRRTHALLFLPRARNNGTGAQTTHTMMQMYLKSVARSLSVFSASSGARYEPNPVMSAAS